MEGGQFDDPELIFCPHCMSWIFTHSSRMLGFVNVRVTLLDELYAAVTFVKPEHAKNCPR